MRVYRVCSAKYTELSGEGARLYGGRWNSPGVAVVYTAGSLALAVLETRVHLRTMPVDYVRLTIEIPDSAYNPVEANLAANSGWRRDLGLTRRTGDTHFASSAEPLKVPSVVVDTEWNLLFSPRWGAMYASIVEKLPIELDSRLWS